MRATEIEPGDVLIGTDGATVYTVVRPLPDRHDDGSVVILVRYEVDGGTDTRCFAPDQDVPLTRVRPITPERIEALADEAERGYEVTDLRQVSEPSTYEQRRAARIVLRRAEEAAAEAKDTLHGLRSRGADADEIARAETVYRDACRAEDDAALVVDRLNASKGSGLTPGGSCRS